MKINKVQLREEGKELVIFGGRQADGTTTENGIVPEHEPSRFKQKCIAVRTGFSGVVEVRPILHADTGFNQAFDHDLRIRGHLEVYRLATEEWNGFLLQASRQIIFIQTARIGSTGGHDDCLADPDGNRHFQRASLFFRFGHVKS